MEIDEAARHFARALVNAGREPSFIFDVMTAYYGEVGREAALNALEEQNSPSAD
jgi:hypothetical protein